MRLAEILKIQYFALRHVRAQSRWVLPYLYVKTATITHKCGGVDKPERKGGYFFRAGDWDLKRKPISAVQESDHRYLFYKEHFVENVPIKSTTSYDYYRSRISRGIPRRGFETEDVLTARLHEYVAMFRSIERAGRIETQLEYRGRRLDEIGCVLARDGEIMKLSNGNNRFAIALILGLPEIPVQIDFCHIDLLAVIREFPGLLPSQKINRFLSDRYRSDARGTTVSA